jgi:hypothetical protein
MLSLAQGWLPERSRSRLAGSREGRGSSESALGARRARNKALRLLTEHPPSPLPQGSIRCDLGLYFLFHLAPTFCLQLFN